MTDATASRRSGLPFVLAMLAAFVLYAATNSPAPIYPLYEQIYGIRPFTVTTIYGVYSLALIPTLLLTGSLAHVIGFRRILSAAWFVGALGTLLLAVAPGPTLLHGGRFLQGIAMGLATGGMAATLVALEPRRDARRASVAITVAIAFGSGLGPVSGGLMAQLLPHPDRLTFWVWAAALAVCGLGFLRLPADLGITGVRWAPRLPAIPDDARGPFLMTCANAFLTWSVAGIFLGVAPSYYKAATGSTSFVLGALPTALTLVCAGLAQLALSKRSLAHAQTIGMIVAMAGFALLVVGGQLSSVPLILLAAVIAGTGLGTAFLGGTNDINQMSADRPDAAGVFAAFAMSCYTGSGPMIIGVGLLGNAVGTTTAVLIFAVAVGSLSVLWLIARWRLDRRAVTDRRDIGT